MAKIYKVKSPAKVNIGLRVLSKRKDGFHNIETIFYPIKIYDEITVKIGKIKAADNKITVTTSLKQKIKNEDNICYKAAKLFIEKFKVTGAYKIDISIRKNVPIGAGLGGGSSDAASVLKALLNHCHPELGSGSKNKMLKQVQHDKLMKIAQELGSDVPFFMLGKPAYATGRGEKLTPLSKFKLNGKMLIVNPNVHISTRWAYKELKVKGSKLKVLSKIKIFDKNDERLMINDFERVVFKKYPKIEKIKYDMFMHGARFALMSGSGSTIYGLFTPKNIKAAEKYFRGLGYKTFISS
jgi:4-diphosphocytidyl-2-C-methyl-D-erythritol kinase